jgi:hypothetical protein
MPDTLAELQKNLAKAKQRYKEIKESLLVLKAWGEDKVLKEEEVLMKEIGKSINELEKSIIEHKRILANADFQDTINGYDRLKAFIDKKFKQIQNTHIAWMEHICAVGLDYSAAYESFNGIMKAQSKYEADMVAIGKSIISLASMGTATWLLSSSKLLTTLVDTFEKNKAGLKVAEDIVKNSLTYALGKLPKSAGSTIKTPFAFKDEILLEALGNLRPILEVVLKYEGIVMACQESVTKLRVESSRKGRGTNLAKEEYEKYLEVSNMITKAFAEVQVWIDKMPESTHTGTDRVDEFKRMFWQEWLPTLETVTPGKQYIGGNYSDGVSTSPTVDYSDWGLSKELKQEISRLLDLKKLGIGENGLDYWASDNDVRLLVVWARSYKSSLKF